MISYIVEGGLGVYFLSWDKGLRKKGNKKGHIRRRFLPVYACVHRGFASFCCILYTHTHNNDGLFLKIPRITSLLVC